MSKASEYKEAVKKTKGLKMMFCMSGSDHIYAVINDAGDLCITRSYSVNMKRRKALEFADWIKDVFDE